MKKLNAFGILGILILVLWGCAQTVLLRTTYRPFSNDFQSTSKPDKIIKVHLKDGGIYVLTDWSGSDVDKTIVGYGSYYNYKREFIAQNEPAAKTNPFIIHEDDITLIETNQLKNSGRNLLGISIAGVPYGIFTIYCIADPKACFGSCPTFYALRDGEWDLISEGFSSSISSSFEKKDVDMLYGADEKSGTVTLKLTNEALETHVIRYVNLLAFPEERDELVFADEQGIFYRTANIVSPESCRADEGDILPLIKSVDEMERYSLADEDNLAKREEVVMRFPNDGKAEHGFLIGSRQTLLTTFLFYQVMAYTGNHYGNFVAEIENGNKHLIKRLDKLWNTLGGIEVFLQTDSKKWEKLEEINEMGPIASDVHLVKLPAVNADSLTVKLRMTKGLWRLDYLALADIVGEETRLRIKPEMVLSNDTICHNELQLLLDEQEPLVTLPGDRYELKYVLPEDCTYQLFLETKGYYLEWMRDEWLNEENLKKAAVALYLPGFFMKKAAPAFKQAEPKMEKIFWESRYVRQ